MDDFFLDIKWLSTSAQLLFHLPFPFSMMDIWLRNGENGPYVGRTCTFTHRLPVGPLHAGKGSAVWFSRIARVSSSSLSGKHKARACHPEHHGACVGEHDMTVYSKHLRGYRGPDGFAERKSGGGKTGFPQWIPPRNLKTVLSTGSPKGTRTPVSGVRGQCPRPLDDGTGKAWLGD